MSLAKPRRFTVEEFFDWQEGQDEKYELVDGIPQKLRMMAGASNGHDDVVVNIIVALGTRLRGSGCRPFTSDGSVETLGARIRRPDVGIDCGPRVPGSRRAENPVVVFEVFSPSTRSVDLLKRHEEYRALPGLRHIVYLEPERAEAMVWSREAGEAWALEVIEGLDGTIALPAVGVSLPMADVYDGVPLGGEAEGSR